MKLRIPDLFGKYRDLLLAIALFLVIDLGVLAFNYQSSCLIETDTSRINLAGELRVYSQQLAKAVLSLKREALDGMPTQTSVAQISEAYSAHARALASLQQDIGHQRELFDDQTPSDEARALLADLEKTWTPIAFAGHARAVQKCARSAPYAIPFSWRGHAAGLVVNIDAGGRG